MTLEFIPGQRWINDAELQLGLGTILDSDFRTVTVLFMATEDTRVYAKASAPLNRVIFAPGDTINSHEGWSLTVEGHREHKGLITYIGLKQDGSPAVLAEGDLDNLIQLNRPTERLFSSQFDHNRKFELRYRSQQYASALARSELRGLTGSRTSLIPHQLYIAHEVANRYAPRVLLADEVGLGKTIEAGLILHQQLLTERANRVMIVVPESLVHQWLVEMLRRFNLHFSIFDEERCLAIEEGENPFNGEQLVLCSLEFLVEHNKYHQQALEAQWDLLVVDEAHHLQWSPQQSSPEYDCIETLAAETKGVILLTATPEQLGKESHFARLRLLDADRFPSFELFEQEEAQYAPIATAVESLLGDEAINNDALETLRNTVTDEDSQHLLETIKSGFDDAAAARIQLVEQLLDRHGTGRVLFRNTRSAVKGFPERQVSAYPLALPVEYAELLDAAESSALPSQQYLLCPELLTADQPGAWMRFDPRIDWLQAQLKSLKPEKVLVITHSAGTAMDIAEALRVKTGLHAALFHEHLSIVERDRAAAYFADPEYGSQVMICSEIGSEGRNFQFAHHLVLFDLPLNPDLLEQRIGRLDRIGQNEIIQIHVPYLENSPQAVMYRWYHEGLNAFEHTCPAGHSVFSQVSDMLISALHEGQSQSSELDTLISTSRDMTEQLLAAMNQGRDRLLEYNSCRPQVAPKLCQQAEDEDEHSELLDYLDSLFDCYGVDGEEHTENTYIIRPGEKMQTSFPALLEDGMTITCDRETALSNEDVHFITWDHPMVTGAMDLVLSSELGNSAFTTIKYPELKSGMLLVESIYVLEGVANKELQASRYFPPSTIRILVDQAKRDFSHKLSHDVLNEDGKTIDIGTASKVTRAYKEELRDMINATEQYAQKQAPAILENALQHSRATLQTEIERLKALKAVNPNVREEEIQFFEKQWRAVDNAMKHANVRLDAVRVVITL